MQLIDPCGKRTRADYFGGSIESKPIDGVYEQDRFTVLAYGVGPVARGTCARVRRCNWYVDVSTWYASLATLELVRPRLRNPEQVDLYELLPEQSCGPAPQPILLEHGVATHWQQEKSEQVTQNDSYYWQDDYRVAIASECLAKYLHRRMYLVRCEKAYEVTEVAGMGTVEKLPELLVRSVQNSPWGKSS